MEETEVQVPDGAEDVETPDPLADVAEADRERLATYLEQERARLAAEAKQAAEAELQQHKAALGTRLKERVRDYAGIEFDENDRPVLKDPNRVLGLMAGQQPQKPAEDPRPDPVYAPEEFAAWTDRQIEKRANAATQKVTEHLQRLEGLLHQQRVQGAETQAQEALEAYGLGQWSEHPGFAAMYRQNLAALDPQVVGTPEAARVAAMTAVSMLDPSGLPKPKPQQGPNGQFVSPSRAGLSQAQPPRGFNGRQANPAVDPELAQAAEAAGMSVDEYQAFASEEGAWGFVDARGGRR